MTKRMVETDTFNAEFYYTGSFEDNTLDGVRAFIGHTNGLRPGETFYFGMWPVKLERTDLGLIVMEFNFETEQYSSPLNKSLMLWEEQSKICMSFGLDWCGMSLEQVVFCSPTVFDEPVSSITEGVHDAPESSQSSGWFLYNDNDLSLIHI